MLVLAVGLAATCRLPLYCTLCVTFAQSPLSIRSAAAEAIRVVRAAWTHTHTHMAFQAAVSAAHFPSVVESKRLVYWEAHRRQRRMANGVPARHRQASGAGQTIGRLCVHDLANTALSLESEVVGSIKVDVSVRLERAAVVRAVLCVDVFARRAHGLAEGVPCGGNVRNEDLEPAVSTPPRLRQSPFAA